MLKSWMHDLALMIQARSGASAGLVACLAVAALAALTAFIFLCIAADAWLALQIGSVYAGLVMAGLFVLVAAVGLLAGSSLRRRARERAILERAARARAPSWLLDPKLLATALQVGRSVGWQRIIPIAIVGFMAAQWAREQRERSPPPPD
jgi:hypothetical protein